MVDVLVRDIPDEVLGAIDRQAKRLGLSRNEFLRRKLIGSAGAVQAGVGIGDLRRFGESFPDLADAQVMRDAWQRPTGGRLFSPDTNVSTACP